MKKYLITLLCLLLTLLLLPCAGEGIIAVSGIAAVAVTALAAGIGLCLLRILDLLVGRIDLLHLLGSHLVPRVYVRVIFFCQSAIGALDLLVGGIGADA